MDIIITIIVLGALACYTAPYPEHYSRLTLAGNVCTIAVVLLVMLNLAGG